MARRRYGDSADVHTAKATAAVREVHRKAAQVIADASAGHCGLAIGELLQAQRLLGAAYAHGGSGARVGTKTLQDVVYNAGKQFLTFCTVAQRRKG